jgi:hypothetical protein
MTPFRCAYRASTFAAEFSTNHLIMVTDLHIFKAKNFRIARFHYISGITLAAGPEANIET